MATWKKVIVSGSNAILNQLNVDVNQQITPLAATTFLSGSFSGSFYGNGSNLTGIASTLNVTGSVGSGSFNLKTQGLTVLGTANEVTSVVTSGSNGITVTVGLPDDVTITNDLRVNGDLTVVGTASFENVENIVVADPFILLASGSSTLRDGGIIVASGGLSGSAFYLEATSTGTYGRFAVAPLVPATASAAVADEYAVTAKLDASSAPSDGTPPTWGGSTNGKGNMWIKEDTGDIYIWA
jgi:hypothetical protein